MDIIQGVNLEASSVEGEDEVVKQMIYIKNQFQVSFNHIIY